MKTREFSGFDEKISYTDERRFAKEDAPESKHPSKNKFLKEIRKNRKSFINCFGCEIFYDE